MKKLFENWRKYLNEITIVSDDLKTNFKQAIAGSEFWKYANNPDDIDIIDSNIEEEQMGTPATAILQTSLNQTAQKLNTEIYFIVSSGDQLYALGPDDPHGGYPNNWMMRGQYRGPYHELDGMHAIWLEFRSITDDFDFDDFDPNVLVEKISTTINHELVHYNQLKKQSKSKNLDDYEAYREMVCDPAQVPIGDPEQYRELCNKIPPKQGEGRDIYLSRHGEIDAYAHEAAEQLINSYGPDRAIEAIRQMTPVNLDKFPEISDVIKDYSTYFKDNPEELKKFRKKVYQQIQQQILK